MGKISEIFNFDNIGSKIKNLAKWSCWITILLIWIAAPITFIVLAANDWTAEFCWIPLVGAIIGPVLVWVESWVLYAFGEFVEDIHAIRDKEGTTKEVNAKRKAEARIKRESELKAQQEAVARARREAEEKAKQEAKAREKFFAEMPKLTKTIEPMDKPNNFQNNPDWKNEIATLSDNEIYIRYIDEAEWSETYRYHCYLELKKRNLQSIQIITNHLEEQNELKILPNGKGYICPLCGFSNTSFSSCAKCSYNPFENPSEETNDSEDEYVDIACPACGEMLSFLKNETNGMCPNCDTEFEIK